jgi:hypothetical protein
MNSPKAAHFPAMTASTFVQRPADVDWLIEGILAEDQALAIRTGLQAPGPAILMDAALSMATGKPFLGCFPTMKRKVALAIENDAALAARSALAMVAAAKNVSLRSLDMPVFETFPRLDQPKKVEEFVEALEAQNVSVLVAAPTLQVPYKKSPNAAAMSFVRALEGFRKRLNDRNIGMVLEIDRVFGLDAKLAFSVAAEACRSWLATSKAGPDAPGTGCHELWMSVGGTSHVAKTYKLKVEHRPPTETPKPPLWRATVSPANQNRKLVRKGASKVANKLAFIQESLKRSTSGIAVPAVA